MINNQYPSQNQQIMQQTQPPQYNNIQSIDKLSIDTSVMAKTASINSAPLQINTGISSGTPYYIPSPRRRRGDHTNYESTIRAFFGRTKQHHTIYDINHSKSYAVVIDPKVDRGFFVAENNWTCYRRNYFQISSVFTCFDINTHEQVQLPCLVEVDKKVLKVNSFSLGISSRVSSGDKKIDIIQHTPKRDKGPQVIPKPKLIKVGGSHNQFASIGNEQSLVTFERLQFKTATANNGKRRAAQQYYVLVLDIIANTEEGEIKVASIESDNLVVRGRSPGHYNDITLNTAIPQAVSMTSSASAAEGRFSRYPLTPNYQYNNSSMILSPHSPASPAIPYHGNQGSIQTPHSMLRQPPINYNSSQPMSGISSNSGTPTNATIAVTTASGMPMNNGYAIKEENNQYYPQNPNGNSNAQNQNQNQNQNGEINNYYDNSQSSSSLYMNQQPTSQSTNQQSYLPQSQAPQTSQQQNSYYQNQTQQQQSNPPQVYENNSFYPVATQPSNSDPYMNSNGGNGQSAQNNNNGYNQTNRSSYQATTLTQTPTQATQTQQNQYINQPYSQQNQYAIQNTTQDYNQNQQGTPQQTYITQPPSQSQAYLTPPQATTQQPPQTNNYMNNVQNQNQRSYMDSPQPKYPPMDKNGQIMGKEAEEYLNSPSSNKNDMINPTKGPAESKDPKNWLAPNSGNPPSISSTQQ